MHEILPGLYLGDLKAAENIEDLRSNNISFILSVLQRDLSPATRNAYQWARISHIHIQKADSVREDLLSILEPACDMIEGRLAKGKAVLVHCALGISRSASVVIAYVMRHLNTSCQEATAFVRTKRAVINPNPAFREQLEAWGKYGFDIQNLLEVQEVLKSDLVYMSRTTEGKERRAEGEEEAKRNGKKRLEGVEEKNKCEDEKEGEEARIEGESGEKKKGDQEGKEKEQDKTPDRGGGKEEAKTETSPNAPNSANEPTRPASIKPGLSDGSYVLVKSQELQNIDDHSTADGPCDPKAATESPSVEPAPEIVRAAIEPFYSEHPAMGKKKMLRILNAEHGWSIGKKEFRSYLAAISN